MNHKKYVDSSKAKKAGQKITKKFTNNTIVNELTSWPFVTVMVCSFMLTYVIPPHWIHTIRGVNNLLQWILNHVPALSMYVGQSSFPEIASVYYPVMMLLSPLYFVFIWRQENQHAHWRVLFSERPIRSFFRLIFTTAALIFIAAGTYFWGGQQLESFPLNDSKLALFLIGHCVAGGAFFGLLAISLAGYKALFTR